MNNLSLYKVVVLVFIFAFFLSSHLPADSEENELVIPADAHQKAIQALKTMGSDRGARSISYRVIDIIGVSTGIVKRSEKINKTLNELGARETETEFQIQLAGDILFEFDKYDIRQEAEKTLKQIAEVINVYGALEVEILGHTDSRGGDTYNQKLSENRAVAVKNWLVKKGKVNSKILKTAGFGESRPIAPNTQKDGTDNPEGRQKNRRVEIQIKKR